jgi:hemolysin-activating ACP:hemolysin acyltransferase
LEAHKQTHFDKVMRYNINKRDKKRIDILLYKSLEFKNTVGQKVKVKEIPVLEKRNPHYFMIQVRLQTFITGIYFDENAKKTYSFREHLKRVLKWPVYEQLFQSSELKHNA